MTPQPYSQLIALKQWADRGLYEVVSQNLERLSQEEASIMLRIFDHIHTVDRIFQHHLQGIPVDFVFTSGKAARMTRGRFCCMFVCMGLITVGMRARCCS